MICIGNVYSVFPTLNIIQTYLTQQNDKDHSEFTRIYIWANTILQFTCLAVCYSQMQDHTVILKLWLHNNNAWLNNNK